ncbi:MAG: hypothetical protein PHQ40_21815, partial [Anaerolineaceae bacterium]|nr:hypothetical protein [Anaerolineaceae bacterium]
MKKSSFCNMSLPCWLILAAFLLGSIFPSQAVQAAPRLDGTEHTGSLTGDETWTPAGNPHYVNGTVTIPAGKTLTIQPGVIVGSYNNGAWSQTGRIIVQGSLNAVGTAESKIIFTSKADSAPSQWGGIQVQGGAATLTNVEVRYGGGGGGFMCPNNPNATVCIQAGGSLTITDSSFHANAPVDGDVFDGVVSAYSANDSETLNLSVQNTRFEDNAVSNVTALYYPIFLDGPGIHLTLAGNTFANNKLNRILLQNNPMKTQAALTLPAQTGLDAYELRGDWTVPASQTLTLNPGVTFLARHGDWGRGVALVVEGKLLAQGSEAQKITLDATDPAYGWSGLLVRGAAGLAQIGHAQILHGGAPGLANIYQSNLVVDNGARLELSDSRVANLITAAANYRDGALMVVNGVAILTRNTIADNLPAGAGAGLYAMRVSGQQSRLEMVGNTFSGNWINAVLLGSDGLAATINTLRPQAGLLGYDVGIPYADYTYTQQPTGQLTLEPGTHVRGVAGPWGKGIYLKIQGQLQAMGSAEDPVVFESASDTSPASWGGIYIHGGAAELYQVRIENAGRGQGYPDHGPFPSLWVDANGRLAVNTATITNNKNAQVADTTVKVENASASIRNSIFAGSGNPGESDYPISISGADSQVTLAGNRFEVNGYKRILLLENAMTGADFSLPMVDG